MGIESSITRRDYFAGLAMQEILSSSFSGRAQLRFGPLSTAGSKELAEIAVLQADALIAELDKPKVADEKVPQKGVHFWRETIVFTPKDG